MNESELKSSSIVLVLFLIIPIISILACFIKDPNHRRWMVTNAILLINLILYLFPILYAYVRTRPNGNIWDENGPGAILWSYFYVLPLCLIILIILVVLKLKYLRLSI